MARRQHVCQEVDLRSLDLGVGHSSIDEELALPQRRPPKGKDGGGLIRPRNRRRKKAPKCVF